MHNYRLAKAYQEQLHRTMKQPALDHLIVGLAILVGIIIKLSLQLPPEVVNVVSSGSNALPK